jgi:hypothetical protein
MFPSAAEEQTLTDFFFPLNGLMKKRRRRRGISSTYRNGAQC